MTVIARRDDKNKNKHKHKTPQRTLILVSQSGHNSLKLRCGGLCLLVIILVVRWWLLYGRGSHVPTTLVVVLLDDKKNGSASATSTTTTTGSSSVSLKSKSSNNKKTPSSTIGSSSSSKVVYVAKFGLGHRLSKMASAYHLARQLQATTQLSPPLVMKSRWGVCGDNRNNGDKGGPIFDYLFGDRNVHLMPMMMDNEEDVSAVVATTKKDKATSSLANTSNSASNKELWIRNDCHGYYAGQNFKNARQPIPPHYLHDHKNHNNNNGNLYHHQPQSPFFQKMDSDYQLFHVLKNRFEAMHSDVQNFWEQHRLSEYTVLGLHVRAGNGETQHFIQANRGVVNPTDFVSNLVDLIQQFWHRYSHEKQQQQQQRSTATTTINPPLLFVATDTPTVIPVIRELLLAKKSKSRSNYHVDIPVVTFPQPQLPPSGGVTYSQVKTGHQCLAAWKAMMVDTILLGQSHVLIAAMRSSFTQIMPLAMVLGDHTQNGNSGRQLKTTTTLVQPRFCEVAETTRSMTCVQDRQSWLFRNPSTEWTLSLDDNNNNNDFKDIDPAAALTRARVVHKVMVHFPDVDEQDASLKSDWQQAVDFFLSPDNEEYEKATTSIANNETTRTTRMFTWGDTKKGSAVTFSQKYRRKTKGKNFTTEWTILPS